MKIEYINRWARSRVDFHPRGQIKIQSFISKDNWTVTKIVIGEIEKKEGKLAFCHEIAHLYLMNKIDWASLNYDRNKTLRHEMEAWKLTKSFCKKEYWDDNLAKDCLCAYFEYYGRRLNADRLKIIPMNKGYKLK